MVCVCANYDCENCRIKCNVSESSCIYLIHDSVKCGREYGESPDSRLFEKESVGLVK